MNTNNTRPTSLAVQGPIIPEPPTPTSAGAAVSSPFEMSSESGWLHPRTPPSDPALDATNGHLDFNSSESLLEDVDERVLEALKGKDRIYVLKLGELMEGQIIERK